ncbi:hypothetical protein U1872_00655 [Sphingomonas sp. RB3P16]|uniref:hypothetical protein n=1 Tax=Parasphingomonas frigoris TaxID=3096163 RepID=UPI002FCBE51D
MQSLLVLLTADGKPVCIDGRTRGKPLAIFRTMMVAPDPARGRLEWFAPQPLRPEGMLSAQQLFDDQIRADHIVLNKPQQAARTLSNALQGQLNSAAAQLSLDQDETRVTISETAAAPLAKSRWWIRNRVDTACSPIYTASNPVVAKNVAFVSVTAGHWGTTYAFHKQAAGWSPVAQWTNWLY